MKLSILAYIIKKVQQGLGIVQDTDTATRAISSGKYVFWKNKFKKASTNIAENDTLSMSNLVDVNDGALNEIADHIANILVVCSSNGNVSANGGTKQIDLPTGLTYDNCVIVSVWFVDGNTYYYTKEAEAWTSGSKLTFHNNSTSNLAMGCALIKRANA